MYQKDLTGTRFGRLVVINRSRRERTTFYTCHCDCGQDREVRSCNLTSGNTTSCGCLQRELTSKRARKPPGHAASRAVWNYYKRNAKTRGLGWELSWEAFSTMIRSPCYYCGIMNGTITRMPHGDTLAHNGIDRKDNSLGYNVDNAVPCCKICNLAKNNLSEDEFVAWIERLTLYHTKRAS